MALQADLWETKQFVIQGLAPGNYAVEINRYNSMTGDTVYDRAYSITIEGDTQRDFVYGPGA